MDRHGFGTGRCSAHTHCDADCDLRTHGHCNTLDSKPNPQPDPVDRNGHHHQYSHLYPHGDSNRHQYQLTDTLPASNRDFYIHFHLYSNSDCDTFSDEYIHLHSLFYTTKPNRHLLSYHIPNHSPPII
jgi:hypothetical protein